MKKTVSALIIISFLFSALIAVIPVSAATPEGTPVSSARELLAMEADGSYYLTADLILTDSYASDFSGRLDGDGHTVTLAGIPSLFESITGGSVSNLAISVKHSLDTSEDVGALARTASGSFENISVTVDYTLLSSAGTFKHGLGGMIGRIDGETSVSSCSAEGRIAITTSISKGASIRYAAGGLIGIVASAGRVEISDCQSSTEISSSQYATSNGGILGVFFGDTQISVSDCQNYGTIVGTSGTHSGTAGICGVADGSKVATSEATFEGCRNYGDISDRKNGSTAASHHIGGIVGRSYGMASISFIDCVNSGDITSVGGGWAATGGIFGGDMTHGYDWSGDHAGVISAINCLNLGNIEGGVFAGGIGGGVLQHSVDGCKLTLTGCSNFGSVSSAGEAGGIIGECGEEGFNGLEARNCYNAGSVTGVRNAGGIIGYIKNESNNSNNQISEYLPVIIDNCANIGEITSTGSNATRYGYTAAGILGNSTREAEISDSVNIGKLKRTRDNAASVAHIAPTYLVTHETSGNLCPDVSPLSNAYVSVAEWEEVTKRAEDIAYLASANLSEIETLIEKASGYKQHLVMSGWEELTAAIAEAEALVLRAARRADADRVYGALLDAIDDIRLLGAPDEAELKATIIKAQSYLDPEESHNLLFRVRFLDALDYANGIRALDLPTQHEVDTATERLKEAMSLLDISAEARREIEKYEEYSEEKYTKSSYRELRAASAALKELLREPEASPEQISEAISALKGAAEALLIKGDTSSLAANLKVSEMRYPKEKYTESSYLALREAMAKARAALSADPSEAEVRALISKLLTAAFELEERGDARLLVDALAKVPRGEHSAAFNSLIDKINEECSSKNIADLSKSEVESYLASLKRAIAALPPAQEESDGDNNKDTDKPETPENEGCGSSLGAASAVLLISAVCFGATLAVRRRRI